MSLRASEIVVTAQKRNEAAVDVPISITAVSGDNLEKAGVRSTLDLGKVVAGLRFDMDGAVFEPSVRGVGNAIAGPGVNPAIATYVDGYYQPSQFSSGIDLVGIDGIQVLKGPQGTLFGRNATGGAIVVTTKRPSFTPGVDATVSYGRYNDVRATAYATSPLSDNVAANIALLYNYRDGFVKNDFLGTDAADARKYTIRAKILWKVADDFSVLLTGERFYNNDNAPEAYSSFRGLNLTPVYVGDPNAFVETKRDHISSDVDGTFKVQGYNANLTLEKEFGDFAKLTSYSLYHTESAAQLRA